MKEKEIKLVYAREHKGALIAKLDGIDDINSAMPFKGQTVYIIRDDAKLRKGECFIEELIGAKVIDEAGENIGILSEVMESPASLIYIVKGEREHLIPAVPEFILKTDAECGVITVHMIEGM